MRVVFLHLPLAISESNQPDKGYIALGRISTKKGFIMMKIAPLERCKSVKIAIATYEITVIFCMYIF